MSANATVDTSATMDTTVLPLPIHFYYSYCHHFTFLHKSVMMITSNVSIIMEFRVSLHCDTPYAAELYRPYSSNYTEHFLPDLTEM